MQSSSSSFRSFSSSPPRPLLMVAAALFLSLLVVLQMATVASGQAVMSTGVVTQTGGTMSVDGTGDTSTGSNQVIGGTVTVSNDFLPSNRIVAGRTYNLQFDISQLPATELTLQLACSNMQSLSQSAITWYNPNGPMGAQSTRVVVTYVASSSLSNGATVGCSFNFMSSADSAAYSVSPNSFTMTWYAQITISSIGSIQSTMLATAGYISLSANLAPFAAFQLTCSCSTGCPVNSSPSWAMAATGSRFLNFTAPSSMPANNNFILTCTPSGDAAAQIATPITFTVPALYKFLSLSVTGAPLYTNQPGIPVSISFSKPPSNYISLQFQTLNNDGTDGTITPTTGEAAGNIYYNSVSPITNLAAYSAPATAGSYKIRIASLSGAGASQFDPTLLTQTFTLPTVVNTYKPTLNSPVPSMPSAQQTFTITLDLAGSTPNNPVDFILTCSACATTTQTLSWTAANFFQSPTSRTVTFTAPASYVTSFTITASVANTDRFHYVAPNPITVTMTPPATWSISLDVSNLQLSTGGGASTRILTITPSAPVSNGQTVNVACSVNTGSISPGPGSFRSWSSGNAGQTYTLTAPTSMQSSSMVITCTTSGSAAYQYQSTLATQTIPLIYPPCALTAPANGYLSPCGSSLASGSLCSFGCNAGYSLSAASTMCNNGVATLQTCNPVACTVSVPNYGTLGNCSTTLQSGDANACDITCNPGYDKVGDPLTKCIAGSLVGTPQSCSPKSCAVTAPYGGTVGNCGSSLANGGSCDMTCNTGFTKIGMSTTCSLGTLSPQTCSGTGCAFAAPVHGSLNGCVSPMAASSNCQLACESGYTLTPSGPLTCSSDASTFTSAVPTCEPNSCSRGIVSNGNAGACSSVASGASCTINCDSSFMVSSAQSICTAGSFTTQQTCVTTSCTLPNVANSLPGLCPTTLTHNSACELQCKEGYTVVGSTTSCSMGQFTNLQSCAPSPCPLTFPTGTIANDCPASLESDNSCTLNCAPGYSKVGTTTTCKFGALTDATLARCELIAAVPVIATPITPNTDQSLLFCGQELTISLSTGVINYATNVATLTLDSSNVQFKTTLSQSISLTIDANTVPSAWPSIAISTVDGCQAGSAFTFKVTTAITGSQQFTNPSAATFQVKPSASLVFNPAILPTSLALGSTFSFTVTVNQAIDGTVVYALPASVTFDPSSAPKLKSATSVSFTNAMETYSLVLTAPSKMTSDQLVSALWTTVSTAQMQTVADWNIPLTNPPPTLTLTPPTQTSLNCGATSDQFMVTVGGTVSTPFTVTVIVTGGLTPSASLHTIKTATVFSFTVTAPASAGPTGLSSGTVTIQSSTTSPSSPSTVSTIQIVGQASAPIGTPTGFSLDFTLPPSITVPLDATEITTLTDSVISGLATYLQIDKSQISVSSIVPIVTGSGTTGTAGSVTISFVISPTTNPLVPPPATLVADLSTDLNTPAQATIVASDLPGVQFGSMKMTVAGGSTSSTAAAAAAASSSGSAASTSSASAGASSASSTGPADPSAPNFADARLITSPADIALSVNAPVTVTGAEDPCAARPGFCQNHGICVAVTVNSTLSGGVIKSSVQLTCSCPASFFGPHCEVGILSCVNSCAAPMVGNASMQIFGTGFRHVKSLVLSGTSLSFQTSAISTSTAQVQTEVKTKSKGGSWDEWVATDFTTYDVLTFTSLPLSVINAQSSSKSAKNALSSLSFATDTTAPAPSYQPLAVHAVFNTDSGTSVEVPYSVSPVYYTASTCKADEFQSSDGGCIGCPEGCECPGAGRCWPLPGYWSYSQNSKPIKCTYPEACPGTVSGKGAGTTLATSAVTGGASSVMNTQACAEGYTGAGCASCADNFYQLNARCYTCGSSNDQTGQMVSIVIAASAVTVGLATAVAVCPAHILVYVVTAFVILQQLATTGQSGAQNIPGKAGQGLASFFSFISVVNFDLQILRPGCSVPTFNFIMLFWATVGLILFSALLFFVACVVRLLIRTWRDKNHIGLKITAEQQSALTKKALNLAKKDLSAAAQVSGLFHTPAMEDFRRRLQHAYLILFTIFYLKLTSLMIKMFQCTMAPDPQSALAANPGTESLYLTADLQTRCYEGTHLGTIILVSILFIVYTLGFPFYTFVILFRAFADKHSKGAILWLHQRFKILRPTHSKKEERKAAYKAMQLEEKEQAQVVGENGKKKKDKVLDPALTLLYIENKRIGTIGYLFLDIRHAVFPYRLSALVMNLAVAFITTCSNSNVNQLFLIGLTFSVESIIVCWFLPFTKWYDNARAAVVALFSLGHAVLMIGIQSDSTKSSYFYLGLVLFASICLFLAFRTRVMNAFNECMGIQGAMVDGKTGAIRTVQTEEERIAEEAARKNEVLRIANAPLRQSSAAAAAAGAEGGVDLVDDHEDSGVDFSITGESPEQRAARLAATTHGIAEAYDHPYEDDFAAEDELANLEQVSSEDEQAEAVAKELENDDGDVDESAGAEYRVKSDFTRTTDIPTLALPQSLKPADGGKGEKGEKVFLRRDSSHEIAASPKISGTTVAGDLEASPRSSRSGRGGRGASVAPMELDSRPGAASSLSPSPEPASGSGRRHIPSSASSAAILHAKFHESRPLKKLQSLMVEAGLDPLGPANATNAVAPSNRLLAPLEHRPALIPDTAQVEALKLGGLNMSDEVMDQVMQKSNAEARQIASPSHTQGEATPVSPAPAPSMSVKRSGSVVSSGLSAVLSRHSHVIARMERKQSHSSPSSKPDVPRQSSLSTN